jgi:hypothetical protein
MKNILLEITENGGRIHKDPAYIEANKNKPNCFFNPDLTPFKGVSPSYYCIKDGKIDVLPESERSLVSAVNSFKYDDRGTIHVKKAIGLALEEEKQIQADIYGRIQKLEHCLDIINSETARFHRVVSSTKDIMHFNFESVRKAAKANNKANNIRFAIVLFIIIALKLIKG